MANLFLQIALNIRIMKIVFTLVLVLLSLTCLIAQTGQYDVRLLQEHPFQCEDGTIYFDIQVKASNAGTIFRVSEQNYRFDYDTLVLTNPRIDQELGFSETFNDGIGLTTYSTHSLLGTLGTTVSYNIILIEGAGYLLTDTWTPVGRVAFDILDPTGCVQLIWRTQTDFPITFIGEIANGELLEANEGNYNNFSGCLSTICSGCPSFLNLPYVIPDNTYRADVSVTSDGTVPSGGIVDYKAGDVILLDNGFTVEIQADFSAEIDDCN